LEQQSDSAMDRAAGGSESRGRGTNAGGRRVDHARDRLQGQRAVRVCDVGSVPAARARRHVRSRDPLLRVRRRPLPVGLELRLVGDSLALFEGFHAGVPAGWAQSAPWIASNDSVDGPTDGSLTPSFATTASQTLTIAVTGDGGGTGTRGFAIGDPFASFSDGVF